MLLEIIFVIIVTLFQTSLENVYAVDFGREFFKVGVASADAARKGNPIDMVLNEESKRKTPSSVAIEIDGITHVGANAVAHAKRRPEASITGFPWLIGDECPVGCKIDKASGEYICTIHNTDVTQGELIGYVADYITSILPLQTPAPAIAVVPPYASIEASTSLISILNNSQNVLNFSDTITTIAGAAASYIMSSVRGQKDVAKAVIVIDSGGWETCIGSVFIDSMEKDDGSNKKNKKNTTNTKTFKIEDGPNKCFQLSGKQIDEAIQNLIVRNSPIHVDERSLQGDAIKCKMTLSANDFCVVHMDDPNTSKHITVRVTRNELIDEIHSMNIIQKGSISSIILDVLRNSLEYGLGQIPVILVGGNTRVPFIKEYLLSEVEDANKILSRNKAELMMYGGVNNDEGIVLGATIVGATQYYNSRVKIYYKRSYRATNQLIPGMKDNRPYIGISRMEKEDMEKLNNITSKANEELKENEEVLYSEVKEFLEDNDSKIHPIFDNNVECPTKKPVSLTIRPEDLNTETKSVKMIFKLADYINESKTPNNASNKIIGGAFTVCEIEIPTSFFNHPGKDNGAEKSSGESEKVGDEKEDSGKTTNDSPNSESEEKANIVGGEEEEVISVPQELDFKVSFNLGLSNSCLPLYTRESSLYSKKKSSPNSEWELVKENIPLTCNNYSYNKVIKKQDNLSVSSLNNSSKDSRPLFLLDPAPGPQSMGNYGLNIKLNNKVREIANLANLMIEESNLIYEAIERIEKWNKIVQKIKEHDNDTNEGHGNENSEIPHVSIKRSVLRKDFDEMNEEITGLYDYYTTMVGHPLKCKGFNKSSFLVSSNMEEQMVKDNEKSTDEAASRLDALKDSIPCLDKALKDLKKEKNKRREKFNEVLDKLENYMNRNETEQKTIEALTKIKQSMEKIIEDDLIKESICVDPKQALKNYLQEEEESMDGILGNVKHSFWQKVFTKSNKAAKEEKKKLEEKYENEYKKCKSHNEDVKGFIKQRDVFYKGIVDDLESLKEKKDKEENYEGDDEGFELLYTIKELEKISETKNKTMKRIISRYRSLKP